MSIKSELMEKLTGDVKNYLEDISRENLRLNVLLDMAKLFGAQTEFNDLLHLIIDQTCKLLDADRATIFIVDHKTNELWSRVGSGIKLKEIRFGKDVGIASLVANTKKTIRLANAYEHPNFYKKIDLETGYTTTSLICVPMLNTEGKVIGVFQVINKNNKGVFTDNDETILNGIAGLAAIRFENIMLIEELKLNEKLSIVGKLTSNISHEIKNLLTPLALAEIIPQLEPNDKRIQKYCNFILQSRDLIVNLLSEIRGIVIEDHEFEMQPQDLGLIVSEVAALMKYDSNLKNCTMHLDIEENLPLTMANQGKMRQVFINIIRNAAQAIPKERKGVITTKLCQKNGLIYATVTDNGTGISEANINQIWQPFFSTKKDIGTGLGLDICKKIIEAHNAQIFCESKVGEGTTFIITCKPIE